MSNHTNVQQLDNAFTAYADATTRAIKQLEADNRELQEQITRLLARYILAVRHDIAQGDRATIARVTGVPIESVSL